MERPPLLGRASADVPPVMIDEPPELRIALQNYVGSVSASSDGSLIAASSPLGGRIMLVTSSGDVIGSRELPDGCGLAPRASGFIATSGSGEIAVVAPQESRSRMLSENDLAFDNHITWAEG